jgi:hypothetical protein
MTTPTVSSINSNQAASLPEEDPFVKVYPTPHTQALIDKTLEGVAKKFQPNPSQSMSPLELPSPLTSKATTPSQTPISSSLPTPKNATESNAHGIQHS